MKNEKSITYVTTYRGVEGYSNGMHLGKSRDVLIAGAEISGQFFTIGDKNLGTGVWGTGTVSENTAKDAYASASRSVNEEFASRIDQMVVYLGKNGAGAGFEYVQKMMEKNGKTDIKLVACDCGASNKSDFARKHNLDIIWSECGGRRALERIVNNLLK